MDLEPGLKISGLCLRNSPQKGFVSVVKQFWAAVKVSWMLRHDAVRLHSATSVNKANPQMKDPILLNQIQSPGGLIT